MISFLAKSSKNRENCCSFLLGKESNMISRRRIVEHKHILQYCTYQTTKPNWFAPMISHDFRGETHIITQKKSSCFHVLLHFFNLQKKSNKKWYWFVSIMAVITICSRRQWCGDSVNGSIFRYPVFSVMIFMM